MFRKYFAVILVSVTAVFSGCANLPVPNLYNDPYDGLSQSEKDKLQLREWNKIHVQNEKLENYVYNLLAKLYGKEALERENIRIALVADEHLGAAVGPDGLVIWNIGNFLQLESEDEVAAILAHEMTHLIAGHHETTNSEFAVDKFMAVGETAAAFSGAGSAMELWAAATSVRWASDSVLFPSFTREEETEADVEAARVLVEAGYNADAVRIILGKFRSFFGDQPQFTAQKMVHETGQTPNGTTSYRVDFDAVLTNVKGMIQERWGQEYESFTLRETAVRELLRAEYSDRKRGDFETERLRTVVTARDVGNWLSAHETGFQAIKVNLASDQDLAMFKELTQTLINDPLTSEVFDYDVLMNAALRNDLPEPAARIGVHLINSDSATLSHYLTVGNIKRQSREYDQAIAAFSVADQTFSKEHDQTLLPLILATKDDAGMSQGNTAIRCLDPTVMMACLKRK